MQKLILAIVSCALFACNGTETEEFPEQEEKEAPAQIGFRINGQNIEVNSLYVASENVNTGNSSHKMMHFTVSGNKPSIVILDMVFPLLSEQTSLPVTWKFMDRYSVDTLKNDYALCVFESDKRDGWHERPYENSFITFNGWDPEKRLASGTFQLFIQNSSDKTDTIKITDGKFSGVRFNRKGEGVVSVPVSDVIHVSTLPQ